MSGSQGRTRKYMICKHRMIRATVMATLRKERGSFNTSVVPSLLSHGVKPKRRTHHQEKNRASSVKVGAKHPRPNTITNRARLNAVEKDSRFPK